MNFNGVRWRKNIKTEYQLLIIYAQNLILVPSWQVWNELFEKVLDITYLSGKVVILESFRRFQTL
jgi:hypothetical protein